MPSLSQNSAKIFSCTRTKRVTENLLVWNRLDIILTITMYRLQFVTFFTDQIWLSIFSIFPAKSLLVSLDCKVHVFAVWSIVTTSTARQERMISLAEGLLHELQYYTQCVILKKKKKHKGAIFSWLGETGQFLPNPPPPPCIKVLFPGGGRMLPYKSDGDARRTF